MRIMVLVFVLAAFVLVAMRSMAQVNPCLLPPGEDQPGPGPAERPDYCTGNAPTITPCANGAGPKDRLWQPTPTIQAIPVQILTLHAAKAAKYSCQAERSIRCKLPN